MCIAQTKDSTVYVNDVFILPHGATFTNTSDSTYFAVPRYRMERLLVNAHLVDSVAKFWQMDALKKDNVLTIEETRTGFWRTVAVPAVIVSLLELVLIIVR